MRSHLPKVFDMLSCKPLLQSWRTFLVVSPMLRTFVIAIFCSICMNPVAECADNEVTLDAVQKRCQQRQDETKSLLMTWEVDYVFRKRPLMSNPKCEELLKDAPEYLSMPIFSELRLLDDRFDERESRPKAAEFCSVPKTRTSFDGEKSYNLGEFSFDDPTGIISNRRDRFERKSNNSNAAMLIFRMMNREFSQFVIDESTTISKTETLDDDTGVCIVLRNQPANQPDKYDELWVDAQWFLPRRYSVYRLGMLRFDLSISYENVAEAQPATWTHTSFLEDGTPDGNVSAVVKRFERNSVIPLSDFQIEWPPGTLVYDEIAGTKSRLPGARWGNRPNPKAVVKISWLFWINIAAATSIFCLVIVRRWSASGVRKSVR